MNDVFITDLGIPGLQEYLATMLFLGGNPQSESYAASALIVFVGFIAILSAMYFNRRQKVYVDGNEVEVSLTSNLRQYLLPKRQPVVAVV